jgi:hypothetical protein
VRVVRIILVNLAILCSVWIGLVIAFSLYHDLRQLWPAPEDEDPRAAMPAYTDHAEAALAWSEAKANLRHFVPFIEWRADPFAGRTLTIGQNGLRVHPGTEPGIPVGLFGGSAMWGLGVTDSQTIPAMFDAATTGYAVTNYADIGWTARQSLDQLINLINDGAMPKVVVFYDGFNEVIALCDPKRSPSINGTTEANNMRAQLFSRDARSQLYDHLVRPVYDGIKSMVPSRGHPSSFLCSRDPARAAAVAAGLVNMWQIAHDLVTQRGGQFLAFLQPVAFVSSPRVDYLTPEVDGKTRQFVEYKAEFEVVYPLIRQKMAGLPWAHDLADAFNVDQPLFVDTVHANRAGNEIIAKRIAAALQGLSTAKASP